MARITRAQWGAGSHRSRRITNPARITRSFLHHTVTPQWVGKQAARNLQRIARERGFLDISYNEIIDRLGNEIEGRGFGRVGAHTRGYNSTGEAVSLVGNFEVQIPPAAMMRGAARSVRRSRVRRFTHSHREVGSTSCPGRHAHARRGEINRMAQSSNPAPAPKPKPTEPEEDEVVKYLLFRAPNMSGAVFVVNPAAQTRSHVTGTMIKELDAAGLLQEGKKVRDVDRRTLGMFRNVPQGITVNT